MPAGRPSEYTEEIIKKAREYLERLPDGEVVPSIEGLSVFLGISRPTVYDWKEKHEEFFYIVDELLAKQATKLANKGLSNEFNASITKLMLTKHGYTDKVEQDITTGGQPIYGGLSNQRHNSDQESISTP